MLSYVQWTQLTLVEEVLNLDVVLSLSEFAWKSLFHEVHLRSLHQVGMMSLLPEAHREYPSAQEDA